MPDRPGTISRATLAALALALAGACAAPASPKADLALIGGAVWTVDAQRPRAEALAIRDGLILAVGTDAEIRALCGPRTRVLDVPGALVLPGFIDNHVHFAAAASLLEFNVMAVSGQEEFEHRVRSVVEGLEPGEWILGGYWGTYDGWSPGSAGGASKGAFVPDVARIQELTAAHPMFIRRFDGRAFDVNRSAMVAAGLDPDDPRLAGTDFLLGSDGRPSGIVLGDGARDLFRAVAPSSFSRERRLRQTRKALAEAARRGVTTFGDMSGDEQLSIFRELLAGGELTCRVHYRFPLDRWRELAERGIRVGSGDDWIRLGSLKGYIDGTMGSSSARFFEPYSNDPANRGRWRRLMVDEEGSFVPGQFLGHMLDADRAGFQLTVHAVGDEANHLLLEYLAELERVNGRRDRRFRLVHAQVIAPDDFARLGKLGVVAEVQPFHLTDEMPWIEESIGADRCGRTYAFRSILEGGAVLCFGTDWPGTSATEYPIDPMLGLYAAVTRKTVAGLPEEGWFPDERITIEQAIHAYTLASAYANFEEDVKGSLTPGKLADVVVLSRNLLEIPPAEILRTEVVATIVGGEVVYER